MAAGDIDSIERVRSGSVMYNEWKLGLFENGNPVKSHNAVKQFMQKKKMDLIHMQIYVENSKHSKIQFYLAIDKIPEQAIPHILPHNQIIEKFPIEDKDKKNTKKTDTNYPQWIWAGVIAIPVLLGLIYYFKK